MNNGEATMGEMVFKDGAVLYTLAPSTTTEPRSPKWDAVRRAFIAAHPICAACGGTELLQAHHEWPFSWPGGNQPDKELNPANLIVLCERPDRNCHLRIGHLLDWKSRNPSVVRDAVQWADKIKHRPYPK